MRWRDTGSGDLTETVSYLQDFRGDVRALVHPKFGILEHARYGLTGRPESFPAADINFDGKVDSEDQDDFDAARKYFDNSHADYDPRADLNRDGAIDGSDEGLFSDSYAKYAGFGGQWRLSSGAGLAPGVSGADAGLDNRFGWRGYWYDPHLQMYHVRNRTYDPRQGQFLQTDPLGFAAGDQNLYRYADGNYSSGYDPEGLQPGMIPPGFFAPVGYVPPPGYRDPRIPPPSPSAGDRFWEDAGNFGTGFWNNIGTMWWQDPVGFNIAPPGQVPPGAPPSSAPVETTIAHDTPGAAVLRTTAQFLVTAPVAIALLPLLPESVVVAGIVYGVAQGVHDGKTALTGNNGVGDVSTPDRYAAGTRAVLNAVTLGLARWLAPELFVGKPAPAEGAAPAGQSPASGVCGDVVEGDPRLLRWLQRDAGGPSKTRFVRETMQQGAWPGQTPPTPIDVVLTPEGLASVDHTRATIAIQLGWKTVPMRIHALNEPLPPGMIASGRFGSSLTWGDAAAFRAANQNPPLPPSGTTTPPALR
ncbi:MAG: RHS repeat-associated core domain-containing protein [Phycisphaerales bacterium]